MSSNSSERLHQQARYLSSLSCTHDIFWPGWFSDKPLPPLLEALEEDDKTSFVLAPQVVHDFLLSMMHSSIKKSMVYLWDGSSCKTFLISHPVCCNGMPFVAGCPLIHNSRLICRLLIYINCSCLWPRNVSDICQWLPRHSSWSDIKASHSPSSWIPPKHQNPLIAKGKTFWQLSF